MSKDSKPKIENPLLDELIMKAKKAQEIYASFTQEQVDAIFKACAIAINSRRIPLAKMANLSSLVNSFNFSGYLD